jgi:predicted dehydrogenase
VDAASAAGVLLMPGHTFEHNAAVHKLRELVRTGQLGRLFYLDCERLNLGLYQADVNVILDLAPHDISISNFVLGSQPTTITAWASRHVHPEHEDVAYLRLDYADLGVRVNVHVSWLSPEKVRRVTAVGSKRMAVYNDMSDGDRIRVYDKSVVPPSEAVGPLSQVAYHLGDIVSPFVAFAEPVAVQDQHFVDCIINDSRPSVDGSSGHDLEGLDPAVGEAILSGRDHTTLDLPGIAHFKLGLGGDVTRFPGCYDYTALPLLRSALPWVAPRVERLTPLAHRLLGRRKPRPER